MNIMASQMIKKNLMDKNDYILTNETKCVFCFVCFSRNQ